MSSVIFGLASGSGGSRCDGKLGDTSQVPATAKEDSDVVLSKVNVVSLHPNMNLGLGYRYPRGTESADLRDSGGIYIPQFIIRKRL